MDFVNVNAGGTANQIIINIPKNITPNASGDYLVQEVHRAHPHLVVPTTTSSTVAFAAAEAKKEGMRLKIVKFNLNLGVVSLSLEWEKDN